MKDNKNTPFLPDLSRFIKTETSGTLYLETLCHYRFSEYANSVFPSFDDHSQHNMSLYTVTGSQNSGGAYSPVLTTFNTPVLGFTNAPFNNSTDTRHGFGNNARTVDGQLQKVNTSFAVGDGQRAILPYSRQYVSFDKTMDQRLFLAGERQRASHMDASQLEGGRDGFTYMIRFRYTGTSVVGNNIFCIGSPNKASISLATISSSTNLLLTYVKYKASNNTYVTKTTTITSGLTNDASNGTAWVTLFFTVFPKGLVNIRLYNMNTGITLAAGVDNVTNDWAAYTSPTALSSSLYFGYGDPAPSTSFLPEDFCRGIEILEFVTFNATLDTSIQQAIARASRSYPKSNWTQIESTEKTGQINRGILYGTADGPFKSGLNNIPVRRALQAFDTRQTMPMIKRSGDPGRAVWPRADVAKRNQWGEEAGRDVKGVLQNSIAPFNDRQTMIFGTSQDVMYPEMLPAAFFSGSARVASGEKSSGSWGTNDETAWSDVHKTIYNNRMFVNQPLSPGIQDVTSFVMNRNLGSRNVPTHAKTTHGVPSSGLIVTVTNTTRDTCFGPPIRPFDDSARPTDTHYISASGTPDTVLPGFDSKLGDKVAIVIDLRTDTNSVCGTVRDINPWGTGSIENGNVQGTGTTNSRHYPIMYYNPKTRSWQRPQYDANWTSPAYDWTAGSAPKRPGAGRLVAGAQAIAAVPCGFIGTTGFTIYPSASDPCGGMPARGRFTDFFGFPYADKYKPNSDDSKIKMSDYISEPFLVESVLFEVEGSVYEGGPDCLGLKMGTVRDLPYTGSMLLGGNVDFPAYPGVEGVAMAGAVDTTQDAPRVFGRGGVIGGGDLRPEGGTTYPFTRRQLDYNSGTPLIAFPTDQAEFFTGNSTFIPCDGLTIVSQGAADGDPLTPVATNHVNYFTSSVYNQANAGDAILINDHNRFTGAFTKNTGSAAPFWRCDTFFLLRCKKGEASGNSWADPSFTQDGTLHAGRYPALPTNANFYFSQTTFKPTVPTVGQTYANIPYKPYLAPPVGWAQEFSYEDNSYTTTVNTRLTASVETRELITYNQMVHYGYVSSSVKSQMIVDSVMMGQYETGAQTKAPGAKSLNTTMFLSAPDTIVSGREMTTGIHANDARGTPETHWDYVLYGNFNTGSFMGRYPDPGTAGNGPVAYSVANDMKPALMKELRLVSAAGIASEPWLERGLGRDLNLNISQTSQEHDLGLLTGSLIETEGQVVFFRRANSSNRWSTFIISTSSNPDRKLSDGLYRIHAPCRQPVIDPGAGSVGVQFTTSLDTASTPWGVPLPSFMGVQEMQSRNTRFNLPDLASGRSATAAVPGVDINEESSKVSVLQPMMGVNAGWTMRGVGVGGTWSNNVFSPSFLGQTTSKTATQYSTTSPYVLLPEDEIIVGFQVAMAGGNPGNPVSINANPGGFAPQGDAGDVRTDQNSKGLVGGDWRRRNQARLDYFDHRFEFQAGRKSKVILYGSLVKNNKEKPPVLNQPLTSDSIREALQDGAVLDQFNVNSPAEYSGSYVAELCAGPTSLRYKVVKTSDPSVDARGRVAGVTGMGISGSFTRFVTLVDQSEVYYDSLIPNMSEIWKVDKTRQGTGARPNILQLALRNGTTSGWYGPEPTPFNSDSPIAYWDWPGGDETETAAAGSGPYIIQQASNNFWKDSFPFEPKYADISRMTGDEAVFGTTGSMSSYGIGWINTGSYARPTSGYTAPTFGPGMGGPFGPRGITGASTVQSELNIIASVRSPGGGGEGEGILPPSKAWRAMALGYGRNNRKWLDLLSQYPGPYLNADYMSNYYVMDHPIGVKYGMANFVKQRSRGAYRYDHYGQFRDMLEQRRYTRFFEEGDDYNPKGITDSPISCIFLDNDGAPVSDPTTTTCFNLSTEATSSKPYFEGETPSRTIIFSRAVSVEWSASDLGMFGGLRRT